MFKPRGDQRWPPGALGGGMVLLCDQGLPMNNPGAITTYGVPARGGYAEHTPHEPSRGPCLSEIRRQASVFRYPLTRHPVPGVR